VNGAAELPRTAEDRAIRFSLVLPVTRLGVGIWSFDPIEQLVGAPVADLLEPLMTEPVVRRPSPAGPAVDVYSLALPEGEGMAIPLGQFGELGFANRDGLLKLTVPLRAEAWLTAKLGDALVLGPERGLSLDGAARVSRVWVRVAPGVRASLPLGTLGEAGIEAS
jgi:hypothetical protein